MSEPRRISLDVVPAERPPKQGTEPPPGVILSEPMRRFRCNQKGCCCSGWDIPFRLEDFLRLDHHLPEHERDKLRHGIQLVLEDPEKGDSIEGKAILHSLKLDGVGENRACRFLEPAGACRVHATVGAHALPDLCVDFPAFPYKRDDGQLELWFDPVCPEVLERIDESDAPLALHRQPGWFGDPNLDPRLAHAADPIAARIGQGRLAPEQMDRIRTVALEAIAHPDRPVWRTLAALAHAFRRLHTGGELAFEVVEPEDPRPFLLFMHACISAHGAQVLAKTLLRYRRFVWAMDPALLVERLPRIVDHLDDWEPALGTWLAPAEDALRPLMLRWLAHRFGTPMVNARGELREAADSILHVHGCALRFASAFGAALERPVDRTLFKVALGAAEFFYRSLHLPREALPWFAAAS